MNYQQLIVLLPCHSLEDFPLHHTGDDAQGLLAAWTALWHPALIAACGKMPGWQRADVPPENVADKLIVVPGVAVAQLPADYLDRAQSEAACLVSSELDRQRIIEAALSRLEPPATPDAETWAGDFLALGYCFLQIELLARKLRYSSNLDEIHFQNQVVAAAVAAVAGQADEVVARLAASFDLLASQRDYYYPSEAFLLDMTMLTPATLDDKLRRQLDDPVASNLLVSGELLHQIARDQPDLMQALRQAVQDGRTGLIGGEYHPRRSALVSAETLLSQFRLGGAQCHAVVGRAFQAFGRQRFGLTPIMPQILTKLGFDGALHATFEAGDVPEGSQGKVRWEGCDGTTITAIARPPLDAAKPQTFVNLGVKLGESLDADQVATICLAHWPGSPSPWYEDLRRIVKYCAALGKFVTIEEYFRGTDYATHQDRFRYDQYRSPYLSQAVARGEPDPISSVVRHWRRRAAAEAAQALVTLTTLATGSEVRLAEDDVAQDPSARNVSARDVSEQSGPRPDNATQDNTAPNSSAHAARIATEPSSARPAALREPADLLDEIDLVDEPADAADLDAAVAAARQAALARFAAALPRSDAAAGAGCLVVNPHSFVCRAGLEIEALDAPPTIARPVYAATAAAGKTQLVVDVPPLGFVWVAAGSPGDAARKAGPTLVEDHRLRNEFIEAQIDSQTGGLRAVREYNGRHNRLGQQLVFRAASDTRRKKDTADDEPPTSIMVADSVRVTVATETLGEITTRGRLTDLRGRPLAAFQQTFRLWRGARVLLIDVELTPEQPCTGDPWNNYYGVRVAWANDTAELHRAANLMRQPANARRFESPLFIEIDDQGSRATILTGGLPFHRRHGSRMLDTPLIVSGERCRHFRLGIGIDLKNPLHEALHLISPLPTLPQIASAPTPSPTSWLFHVDARNVIATHWEPIIEAARAVGFRARLLETQGRQVTARLQCFRTPGSARKVNFQDGFLAECPIENDAIPVRLTAYEWAQVEARW